MTSLCSAQFNKLWSVVLLQESARNCSKVMPDQKKKHSLKSLLKILKVIIFVYQQLVRFLADQHKLISVPTFDTYD